MNDKVSPTGISQTADLPSCENLSDEDYYKFHSTVLKLIATAIDTGKVFLPTDFYCTYKGYIKLSDNAYRNIQAESIKTDYLDWQEMYHSYRIQTEINYRLMCKLIVSVYKQTGIPEERENLKKLIEDIKDIVKQIKTE